MFGRNPCRVDGGVGTPVSAFPGGAGIKGFVYLVQCISDRNYAMRAFCLDGHPSACYVTYKPPRCINKNCTWLSPTNLNQHGSDLTIVDSCHTDLTNPTDGESCLTTANLLAACSAPGVECFFVNNFKGNAATSIAQCAAKLKCLSLVECSLNQDSVAAMAGCTELRGIVLGEVSTDDAVTDAQFAQVLRSNPKLMWLQVSTSKC